MGLSRLEIKARARLARYRAEQPPDTQPSRSEVIQADPRERLDSWVPEISVPEKRGPGRPRKDSGDKDVGVDTSVKVPETSSTRKKRPTKPMYTEKNKQFREPRALQVPVDNVERKRRLTIHLTPAEEKEIREYIYKWQLPAGDWARVVLLDKVRNDY